MRYIALLIVVFLLGRLAYDFIQAIPGLLNLVLFVGSWLLVRGIFYIGIPLAVLVIIYVFIKFW